jgi:hypothetical protein
MSAMISEESGVRRRRGSGFFRRDQISRDDAVNDSENASAKPLFPISAATWKTE